MKKYILLVAFAGILGTLSAQQALTFYNMDRVMQSQFVNPSIDVPYKVHIGGLLVPIAGQLPPPMYFNYANNSFHWNHIYHEDETNTDTNNFVLDLPLFMNKLRNTTHMRFDTQFELINVGIKLENMFLTFAITDKYKYGLSLPYDMFELTLNGNMPYMLDSKPHDFSGLGVNFTHYHEFAVGGSMKANDEFTFGGRVKILFGCSNINTDIKDLSLYTDPDDYSMTWKTDMKIQTSFPDAINYQMHSTEGIPDSITFGPNQLLLENFTESDPSSPFGNPFLNPLNSLNFKNIGLGFDLGASYKFNPEIEFFASVTDFGFITWNSNPQNYVSEGEYDFRGIELEIWENDEDMEESLDKFVDTLFNTFKYDLVETGYVTWLPSSLYLGGKYKFHELLHFTALYRGEFYRKTYMQSFTLGVNSNLTNWLSAHLTWSLANGSASNLGIGISARAAIFNWYIVTDGLTNFMVPHKAKNLNLRMGCNIVFGYKKIKSNASMRT